jgi:hypothetical protein
VAVVSKGHTQSNPNNHKPLLPAFFALAHLAFIASDLAFLTAAESFFLAFFAGLADGAVPLIFAHLANCAALILALPAALTLFLLGASYSAT